MTEDFDAEFAQKKLGDRADGNAGGGFAGRGAFEHVAGFGKVVFQGSGQIGVAGTRRADTLVFRGIALADGQGFLPVFPVAVFQFARRSVNRWSFHGERRRECGPCRVSIFMRPPRPYPCWRRQSSRSRKDLIDLQPGRNAGKEGD